MVEERAEDGRVLSAEEGTPAGGQPAVDLERLFREHHARVFRAAYRVTGSESDAEDVLQTVFLRLARRSGPVDLSPSPASYLYRSAVNAALDIVRSRPHRNLPIEAAGGLADPRDRPDEGHRSAEIRALVRAALAELSPRSAEIFVLRYFEGLTNEAIARMLGISPGSVAVALHRARARLKRSLARRLARPAGEAERDGR